MAARLVLAFRKVCREVCPEVVNVWQNGCSLYGITHALPVRSFPMPCATDSATVRFWRDDALDAVEVRYSHFEGYRFPAHVHETWSVGLVDDCLLYTSPSPRD